MPIFFTKIAKHLDDSEKAVVVRLHKQGISYKSEWRGQNIPSLIKFVVRMLKAKCSDNQQRRANNLQNFVSQCSIKIFFTIYSKKRFTLRGVITPLIYKTVLVKMCSVIGKDILQ